MAELLDANTVQFHEIDCPEGVGRGARSLEFAASAFGDLANRLGLEDRALVWPPVAVGHLGFIAASVPMTAESLRPPEAAAPTPSAAG